MATANRASAAAAPISPRASGGELSYRCESEGAWLLPEPGAATSCCGEERRALFQMDLDGLALTERQFEELVATTGAHSTRSATTTGVCS